MNNQQQAQSLRLPTRLFATQKKMDDYYAADMRYGDLSQHCLQQHFGLRDISTRINPFTYKDRDHSARVLFEEFRQLSDTFSFIGEYQPIIRKMINHMQFCNGEKFTDYLLNKALAEHLSINNSLNKIRETIISHSHWDKKYYPRDNFNQFGVAINASYLPKFNRWIDNINGLTISVHDTWATHITLESLGINGDRYHAKLQYRIQDHFGLDDSDIIHRLYRQFRIFRIWFVLQRWEGYGFRPFISEMNTIKTIEGSRFDKI
ncbi:DUF3289 family protein [Pantoea sp. B65]|uniref:DUF3289 family protein n=1 Tax=Pantoea sp. B65 TaxID=2813359 RepID=UPI0039B6B012